MGVSPELVGESKKDKSEQEKRLTEILVTPEIIDKLATLKDFSTETHLVAGFAVYKDGRAGDIIVPDETEQSAAIVEQVGFDCSMFEPENPEEVYMVIHSHPTHNKHCLKFNNKDLLAPTVQDVKDWYQEETQNPDFISGVLVCDGYCSLKLFNFSPKIKADVSLALRLDSHFGDERKVAAKAMEGALVMCNIGSVDISLDCDEKLYKRRVKKASHLLLGPNIIQ